jgi:hypothetical protein
MNENSELTQAHKKAWVRYNQAKNKLTDPETPLTLAAQEANDAWLEYKKLTIELENFMITQQMEDLYAC